MRPKGTAVSARTAEAATPASEPLAVIATNGSLGNGHAANGNGKASNGNGGSSPVTLSFGNTKVSFQTQADAPSCAECGSIMVRNGSLLQVPQLREHQRLQLTQHPAVSSPAVGRALSFP